MKTMSIAKCHLTSGVKNGTGSALLLLKFIHSSDVIGIPAELKELYVKT